MNNYEEKAQFVRLINKKLNLGLDISGKLIYNKGVLMTPWDIEKIVEAFYLRERDEFLNKIFIEHLNEQQVSQQTPKDDPPPEREDDPV